MNELKKPESDIFTCTLFRKDKPSEYPQPDLFGLSIPDVWVVGYGLDDAQEKRGWPRLYACPKLENIPRTDGDKLFDSEDDLKNVQQQLAAQLKALQSLNE